MQGSRVERKLAAIFAGDVVGYSRLMGTDEVGTLSALKAHQRELIDPLLAEYHGRMVKTTGDGVLAEFASAVDAVGFAVVLQKRMADRNDEVPPDRAIALRVEINIDDIIVEDSDIYGDGGKVAARLESLAEPGGICISEDAYRQVRDKLPDEFTDRGEQVSSHVRVNAQLIDAETGAHLWADPFDADRSDLLQMQDAQLRARQLAIANNPVWVKYNERLFDGLRNAGMAEQ